MNRSNFNNLIFNPIDISDEELLSQCEENERLFSALGGMEGFLGDEARHKSVAFKARMARYVLLLYDKESPLWMTHPDIVSRKKQAALLAGYDIIQQSETLEDIYHLRDPFLAKAVSSFIKFQHSAKLSALITSEQVLYDLQVELLKPMTDFNNDKQKIDHHKVKTALIGEQSGVLDMIEKYKREIWREDEDAYEKTMEIEFGVKVRPEQIAKIELKRPRIKGLNV